MIFGKPLKSKPMELFKETITFWEISTKFRTNQTMFFSFTEIHEVFSNYRISACIGILKFQRCSNDIKILVRMSKNGWKMST